MLYLPPTPPALVMQVSSTWYAVTVNAKTPVFNTPLYLINPNLFYPTAFSANPQDVPANLRFSTTQAAQAYIDEASHRYKQATWGIAVVAQ